MAKGARVLVVDDDPHIREVVRFALAREGYDAYEAKNGAEALRAFDEKRPALVVLDILMPGMDGREVCQKLRARAPVPIIFLSSKDEEVDRILGLELGGDDYVTKPFSPRELAARVRAVLRRAEQETHPPASRTFHHGKLALDRDRFEATWDGQTVALTATEFGILEALIARPGKVFTRDELMSRAYDEPTVVTDRTIDSHVRRLRKKLADVGGDPVDTVHGVGYRLGSCE